MRLEHGDIMKKPLSLDSKTIDDLLQVDLTEELPSRLTEKPHVKLPMLNSRNYDIWADDHQRFLESRGLIRIVTGELPFPGNDYDMAKRWVQLDGWMAVWIAGHVHETQKGYIFRLKTSKEIWDKMRRVHGVSGKGIYLCSLGQDSV